MWLIQFTNGGAADITKFPTPLQSVGPMMLLRLGTPLTRYGRTHDGLQACLDLKLSSFHQGGDWEGRPAMPGTIAAGGDL